MNIRVGQIWKDNDRRVGERYLKIDCIIGPKAVCSRVRRSHSGYGWHIASERQTRILVARLNGKLFEVVE